MDKIEKLEAKVSNLKEAATQEGFKDWLELPYTKILLLQMQIDLEELGQNWRNYDNTEHVQAKAQAQYIEALPYIIEDMLDD